MDSTCLQYTLTEEERRQFAEDGFFIVRDVLPRDLVAQLIPIVDRLAAEYRPKKGLEKHQMHNLFDFIGKDELFLELLDWPKTFAKVFGILGWHIQLYHSHLIVTPPLDGVVPSNASGLAGTKTAGGSISTWRLIPGRGSRSRWRIFSRTAPRPIAATSTPCPART